ncbi:MAG: transposase [bacterium]|nr:transposase [bacterium]
MFKARFALLKRADTLTGTDRARLDAIFDAHPRLEAAWQALQQLRGLYDADDHQGALQAPNRFSDLYQTGQLPEFHDIANTLTEWSDEILNRHHTGRPSNGRTEGTNNLLQVLRRTAHGFTNPHNFQARGLLIT